MSKYIFQICLVIWYELFSDYLVKDDFSMHIHCRYLKKKQSVILLTIKTTKWETKKMVVKITPQRPKIIGREAKNIGGCYVSDPFCAFHQSIGEDHLL